MEGDGLPSVGIVGVENEECEDDVPNHQYGGWVRVSILVRLRVSKGSIAIESCFVPGGCDECRALLASDQSRRVR